MNRRLTQKGSALFIILIAVALFAALSYTVAQMLRAGNPESMSAEKVKLFSGEVLDYARNVREAVQAVRISGGCEDTEISFENNIVAGYTNGTNTKCQVFHPNGGGLNYVPPIEDWLDVSQSAGTTYGQYAFVRQLGVEDVGSSAVELALVLNYVRDSICEAINTKLGITNPSGAPPLDIGAMNSTLLFTGTYDASPGDINAPQLLGKPAGCVKIAAGTYNVFYQVLIAR